MTSLLLSIINSTFHFEKICSLPICSILDSGFKFESELLIKAVMSGYKITHLDIPTIYNNEISAMKNFQDTIKFTRMYFQSFLW